MTDKKTWKKTVTWADTVRSTLRSEILKRFGEGQEFNMNYLNGMIAAMGKSIRATTYTVGCVLADMVESGELVITRIGSLGKGYGKRKFYRVGNADLIQRSIKQECLFEFKESYPEYMTNEGKFKKRNDAVLAAPYGAGRHSLDAFFMPQRVGA